MKSTGTIFFRRWQILKFLIALPVGFLTACAVLPKNYSGFDEGRWTAKALIKDAANRKSYVVRISFWSERDRRLKMDVMSTLGTPLAALYLEGRKVEYLIFDQRKYYLGTANERSLESLLSVSMDPRWLYAILFDQPIVGDGWNCLLAEKSPQVCENIKSGLRVHWSDPDSKTPFVRISQKDTEVQLILRDFQPKVEDKEKVFGLLVPEGFTRISN